MRAWHVSDRERRGDARRAATAKAGPAGEIGPTARREKERKGRALGPAQRLPMWVREGGESIGLADKVGLLERELEGEKQAVGEERE